MSDDTFAKMLAQRAKTQKEPDFAPWSDYSIPQKAKGSLLGKSPVIVVTFEDGEVVRAPAVSMPRKLVNIGRGLRIAMAFYQCRMARRVGKNSDWSKNVDVPKIVSVICESNDTKYDAADFRRAQRDFRKPAKVKRLYERADRTAA